MNSKPRDAPGPERKTKIFISYSRKDAVFTDQLEAALKSRSFETLIDREAIADLEDWRRRVETLIVQADTVVFVVSPDSVASPACVMEVEFAGSLKKRFAPIIWRAVDDKNVPDALERIHRIDFANVPFDEAADRLAKALSVDIGWIRQQTEYGEAARRWSARGRRPGDLLRSRALDDAETWNASRPRNVEAPNDEIQRFIIESRRRAIWWRNATIAGLAGGLTVTVALLGLAIWQRSIAVEQRNVALRSQSRFLADLSRQATERSEPGKGLLLALEGLPGGGQVGQRPYVPDAELSLHNALCSNNERFILPHDGTVTSARFSPDGKSIVTSSYDKTARLWNAATGAAVLTLRGHDGPVLSAAFSPDGLRVVTASVDKTVRIWDSRTGAQLLLLSGHQAAVGDASFNADGTRVVSASKDTTARIWDAQTGQQLLQFDHQGAVAIARFSPDGRSVVTASQSIAGVSFWDAETGASQGSINATFTSSADYSPNGQYVITADQFTKNIKVWDAGSRRDLGALTGLTGSVNEAHFDPSGTRILAALTDGSARIWDLRTGGLLASFIGPTWAALSIDISRDGSRVVTASKDRTARVWETRRGCQPTVLNGHAAAVQTADFSADGSRLVTASNDGTARVWDVKTGQAIAVLDGNGERPATAYFNADGTRVITTSNDATLRMWDAQTGQPTWSFKSPVSPIWSAVLSPDASVVLAAIDDGTARTWDATTAEQRVVFKGHNGPVVRAEFSPDGARVMTASRDGTLRSWNAKTGDQLAVIKDVGDAVSEHFNFNGTRIVTTFFRNSVAEIWDADTGAQLAALAANGPIDSADFSPDGTLVLTVSSTATLWDVRTGARKFDFPSAIFLGGVHWAAFLPNGERIVTAIYGSDGSGTIQIWDVASGGEVARFKGPVVQTNSGAISSDGKNLAIVSQEGSVLIFHMFASTTALIDAAKEATPRCLTPDERISAFLAREPPDWCIEMHKWPYHTQAWRDWLAAGNSGHPVAMPEADPTKSVKDCVEQGGGPVVCHNRQPPPPGGR